MSVAHQALMTVGMLVAQRRNFRLNGPRHRHAAPLRSSSVSG
jgi:hypothetical protein